MEAPPDMYKKGGSCSVREDAAIIHYIVTCHRVAMNQIRSTIVGTLMLYLAILNGLFLLENQWPYLAQDLISQSRVYTLPNASTKSSTFLYTMSTKCILVHPDPPPKMEFTLVNSSKMYTTSRHG